MNSKKYDLQFSVILPVHNGGEYIKQCVTSILGQTYTNFNLLILENASTDGTLEWLQTIDDTRVTIFASGCLLSFEANWSRISEIKTNEFLTIIGHDDILDPDYLEAISKLILLHPKATLYQTHFRFIDASGKLIRHSRPMCQVLHVHEFIAAQLTFIMDSMGTGYMMRRKDFDLVGGFSNYPNLIFGDYELWVKLIALGYLAIAQSENFSYREHNSASASTQVLDYKNSLIKYWHFLENVAEQNNCLYGIINRYGISYLRSMYESLVYRSIRLERTARHDSSKLIDDFEPILSRISSNNNYVLDEGYRMKVAKLIDERLLARFLYKALLRTKRWIRNESISLF